MKKGLFTDGPGTAFGGELRPIEEYNQSTSPGINKTIDASKILFFKQTNHNSFTASENLYIGKVATGRDTIGRIEVAHKSITPEVAQTVDCVKSRANVMKFSQANYSGTNKATIKLAESVNSLIDKASKGELSDSDKKGTKDIEATVAKKGSYLDEIKPLMKQIRAMDNTMKYVKENVKSGDFDTDLKNNNLQDYNFYTDGSRSFSDDAYQNINSKVKKINDGDIFTQEFKFSGETNISYFTRKGEEDIEVGSFTLTANNKVRSIHLSKNKDDATKAGVNAALEDIEKIRGNK